MVRNALLLLLVGVAGLVIGLGACASGSSSAPSGGGFSSTGSTTASGIGGSTVTGILASTSGVGSCDDLHCSSDLHQVLGCGENVIKTCPADQGCGKKGTCVDPCESAAENQSTIGCEFFSVIPGPDKFTRGSCFAAFVANIWSKPVTISADYGGGALDMEQIARVPQGSGPATTYAPLQTGQLQPGQIAILFLASTADPANMNQIGCPSGTTPLAIDPMIDLTGIGTAFHITTTAPVVAYDMYPYGGSRSQVGSATLLVPTEAWGTSFVAADGYKWDPESSPFGALYPHIQIVATTENTKVTIQPSADIVAGTDVDPATKGVSKVYTVNRGKVLQFMQPDELAGSIISADKPIGLWGGSACMRIHVGETGCDSGHQQLLPTELLGSEYPAVRYRNRAAKEELVPWTVVGVADKTTLTYEPSAPFGAPTKLSSGEVVEFDAAGPFVVKSQDAQHPFYFAEHMTGGDSAAAAAAGLGDPEYVSVVPGLQFLKRYLFMTDPTYGTTNLVFIRHRGGKTAKFADVNLDCAGTLSGWQPVGTSGVYEFVRFDLVTNYAPQGSCDNGVHLAESTSDFGLTVWGWDAYTSYAYPAGMSVKPLNKVIVVPK